MTFDETDETDETGATGVTVTTKHRTGAAGPALLRYFR